MEFTARSGIGKLWRSLKKMKFLPQNRKRSNIYGCLSAIFLVWSMTFSISEERSFFVVVGLAAIFGVIAIVAYRNERKMTNAEENGPARKTGLILMGIIIIIFLLLSLLPALGWRDLWYLPDINSPANKALYRTTDRSVCVSRWFKNFKDPIADNVLSRQWSVRYYVSR